MSRSHLRRRLPHCSPAFRLEILSRFGAQIDVTAVLHSPCYLENVKPLPVNARLKVGAEVYVGSNCTLDVKGGITIGSRVTIAYGCCILSHIDVGKSRLASAYPAQTLPVLIGDDVYIGAGSLILPGVSLGNGCLIGAGSVVTKDVPAGVVAAGVPARMIKRIAPQENL